MNRKFLKFPAGFFSFILIGITAVSIQFMPSYVGLCLILWSFIVLYQYISFMKPPPRYGEVGQKPKPVHAILRGLSKKQTQKNELFIDIGLKTPLIYLGIFSLAFAGLSAHLYPERLIEDMSFILLCGLVFWVVQKQASQFEPAKFLMITTGFLFLYQLSGVETLPLNIALKDYTALHVFGGMLFGGFGAFIFLRGMIYRHRHRIFPFCGLVLLTFGVVFAPYMQAYIFMTIIAMLGVCFAQSFRTASAYYGPLGPRYELYS